MSKKTLKMENYKKIDYNKLERKKTKEIIRIFLNQVTLHNNKKISTNELKIYILKAQNITHSSITSHLNDRLNNSNKSYIRRVRNFIDRFIIDTKTLNDTDFLLVLTNRFTQKNYFFVVFTQSDYWIVFTLTSRKNCKKTLESLANILESLEIINLTSKHLETIVQDSNYQRDVSGFTAKYEPYHLKPERKITVQVHGGHIKDLEKMRSQFSLEPISFQVKLRNSPVGVTCKIKIEGNFTIESIYEGKQHLAEDMIESLIKSYEEVNENIFEEVKYFDNYPKVLNDYNGLSVNSWYHLIIKIKENRFEEDQEDDKLDFDILDDSIVKYFRNKQNKQRYIVYSDFKFSHFICDEITRNKVQITLDPQTYSIILTPINKCSGRTLRDICIGINNIERSIEKIQPYSYK